MAGKELECICRELLIAIGADPDREGLERDAKALQFYVAGDC